MSSAVVRPAAVLFDLDGLLVDSEPLWFEAESAVAARLGGSWSLADQQALLGGTMQRTVRYLLAHGSGAAAAATEAEVGRWLLDGMTRLITERGLPLQPGAGGLHAELTAAGVPVALVSSSQPEIVSAALAATGLSFDAVVTGGDVANGKPHPEPYLRAAAALRADPLRCVALEDSATGAASARAAGCAVVLVPEAGWSGPADPAGRSAAADPRGPSDPVADLVAPSLTAVDLAVLSSLLRP